MFERVRNFTDRLFSSPQFADWAVAFPLTRPIARRRARALFDLCAGFVYSQILSACIQVRVFDKLHDGPKTIGEVSTMIGLDEDATGRLLKAAAALDLLDHRGGTRYGLGILGAAVLANPGIAAMVEHHRMLYADLRDPVAILRHGGAGSELGRYWPYAQDEPDAPVDSETVAGYSALMGTSQAFIAREVLRAYPLHRHDCLLDVGGGEGAFLKAVAEKIPGMRLMLFDLPPVAERAQRALADGAASNRITALGGNFLSDPLPSGADIISLIRIVHDHDDEAALTLLRAVYNALPDGGVLLLAEPMSGTPGAESVGDAYFGMYLLAMGSGRPRTPATLKSMLRTAGFSRIRLRSTHMPMLTRLLVAHKQCV